MRFATRQLSFKFFIILITFVCFVFPTNKIHAATINVSSIAALQTAINNSNSGDEITLANGTYTNSVITINKNQITVRAFSPGKVFLNGTQEININGNGNTFSGFQFTS